MPQNVALNNTHTDRSSGHSEHLRAGRRPQHHVAGSRRQGQNGRRGESRHHVGHQRTMVARHDLSFETQDEGEFRLDRHVDHRRSDDSGRPGTASSEIRHQSLGNLLGNRENRTSAPGIADLGRQLPPRAEWEFAVDLQYVLWSAYDQLDVQILNPSTNLPVLTIPASDKNYSNTLAFRFGGEYHALDWLTARMGMYVDESPVSSDVPQSRNAFD